MRLSGFWAQKPVALVFLRHFGCTFCREQVALLRRDYGQFRALGAEVVCVGQGDHKTAKAFSLFFGLPFPLLVCGDDVSVYRAYGLGRGTWGQLFGWREFVAGVAATLRGHLLGRLVGDGTQMAGAFVVDTGGIVRYARPHRNAADNPDTRDLLRAVQDLRAGAPE